MEADCLQLSIEGERLLKAQDYNVLSAVYNQLGNACFYVGKFQKALEYHKKDLEIAKELGDRQGQAKAYGNLGNTYKSLKTYENAIKCCENHLRITRELTDKLGEGRACYNLGNVHHAVGKAEMAKKKVDPTAKERGAVSIRKAIVYYRETLVITSELKDTAGEGRAVGNLGNAYTAIGEYKEAITFHERRYEIAKEARDQPAKARACGNLGNAFSALGEFSGALKYYQQSLVVSKDSGNLAGQGQAYYCLGTTYSMLKNYVKAIEFHELHVEVAQQLKDKAQVLRGYYNLRNAHHQLGDPKKMAHYHKLIRELKPEDAAKTRANAAKGGRSASGAVTTGRSGTAHQPIAGRVPGDQVRVAQYQDSAATSKSKKAQAKKDAKVKKKADAKAKKGAENEIQAFVLSDSESDSDDDLVFNKKTGGGAAKAKMAEREKKSAMDSWLASAKKEVHTHWDDDSEEEEVELPSLEFFDMLMQVAHSSELNEQRAAAPGGEVAAPKVHPYVAREAAMQDVEAAEERSRAIRTAPDISTSIPTDPKLMDAFFDKLCETESRTNIDDQRAGGVDAATVALASKDLSAVNPDEMDFFSMIALAE